MSDLLLIGGDGKYLVYDSFSDREGLALASHIPDVGGVWTSPTAGITIESGRASDNDVTVLSVIDVETPNVILEADIVIQGGGSGFHGLAFRYQDTTHYWIAGCDVAFDKVTIWENNGGSWAERSGNGNGSFNFSAGEQRNVKVVLSGTSIVVLVDGTQSAIYASSLFQTATKHGLYADAAGGGVDGTWDNFSIRAN